MLKTLFRTYNIRRKSANADERKMVFIASDATRDSYGTVLPPDKWDLSRFEGNPVIGYNHKVYGSWSDTENPDNVIGKGRAWVEDDCLMVEIEFEPAEMNALAEKVWKKIQWGSLNAVSVGFTAEGGHFGEGEEGPGQPKETYYYDGMQLVEVSVVNIPANPNALKNAMADELDRIAEARKAALEAKPKPEPEEKRGEQEDFTAERGKTVLMAEAALQL